MNQIETLESPNINKNSAIEENLCVHLIGVGSTDRWIGVGAIGGAVVGEVVVRAKDIIGPEIEALRSRVDPTRCSGSHGSEL